MKNLILLMSCFLLLSCLPEAIDTTQTETESETETETEFGAFLTHNNPKAFKLNESITVEYLEGEKIESEVINVISEINFDDGLSYNNELHFNNYNGSGLPGNWEKIGGGFQLNLVDGKDIGSAIIDVMSNQSFNFVVFEFSTSNALQFPGGYETSFEVKSNDVVIRNSTSISPVVSGDKYLIPINLGNDYSNISVTFNFQSDSDRVLIANSIEAVTYNFSETEIKDMIKSKWVEEGSLSESEAILFINGIDVNVENVMASKPAKEFSNIGYNVDEKHYDVNVRMHSDEQYLFYYFSKIDEETLWFEIKIDLNELMNSFDDDYQYKSLYTDINGVSETKSSINKDILKLNSYVNVDINNFWYSSYSTTHNYFFNGNVELDRIMIVDFSNTSRLTKDFHFTSGVEDGGYYLNLENENELNDYEFSEDTRFMAAGVNVELPLMTGLIELVFDVEVDVETVFCYLNSYNNFNVVGQTFKNYCINKSTQYSMVKSVENDDSVYFDFSMFGGEDFIENYYQIKLDNVRVNEIKKTVQGWESTWDLKRYIGCNDIPFSDARLTILNYIINGVVLSADTLDTSEFHGTFIDEVMVFTYENLSYEFNVSDAAGLIDGSGIIFSNEKNDCSLVMSKFIP
ncbi:hypothetical protein [Marinicellulosiphila megalodicopiae]|uniref:hypothetical protein n=1 Tax=Marinicellulosiphila megalodicopiae TaxID=2724896 RepID=UPI003BAEC3A1